MYGGIPKRGTPWSIMLQLDKGRARAIGVTHHKRESETELFIFIPKCDFIALSLPADFRAAISRHEPDFFINRQPTHQILNTCLKRQGRVAEREAVGDIARQAPVCMTVGDTGAGTIANAAHDEKEQNSHGERGAAKRHGLKMIR